MQVKEFEEFHKTKNLKHNYVAQRIKVMDGPIDKAGEMNWSRIRRGEVEFPKHYRGRKVKGLAEIYGVSVDVIMKYFGLED
jgi:hypothetical protein